MRRCILHVDMDAFFAAVEQRDHPEWRGQPVIVGAPPDQRGVVSTCSYEARAFGVHSAMPSREAYRRCPQGIFVPPDMARYDAASRRVFSIFERFSPLIEPVSIDEAFIDVTGARTLFGEGMAIAQQIRAAIRAEVRLTASVGVAHNKFLAKLASEKAKPDGLFVVPEERESVVRFLGALKVGALWGVGKVTGEALERAGFRTVADLQAADPAYLTRLLGESLAAHLLALASGEDAREVETAFEEKSLSREYTFPEDCRDRETVREILKELADEVGQRVRAHCRYATVGRLKLRWSDFRTITRQAPFETAVCDDFSFRAMAMALFDAERLIQPVRLIGFGVSGFSDGRSEQLSLFDDAPEAREKRERLCRAVDALREKLGDKALGRCPRRAERLPPPDGNVHRPTR
ncbi:MAG TPA: DNA polymerase IV [Kiritimatiellia bacterium]|nr:DNA polymerase IV [Kiritimatiellia bacterium]HPS07347.1 DNA polymerase IV [Kiritimatiellia bacterium]